MGVLRAGRIAEPEPADGGGGFVRQVLPVFQGAQEGGGLELLLQTALLGLLFQSLHVDVLRLFFDVVLQTARLFRGGPVGLCGGLALTRAQQEEQQTGGHKGQCSFHLTSFFLISFWERGVHRRAGWGSTPLFLAVSLDCDILSHI